MRVRGYLLKPELPPNGNRTPVASVSRQGAPAFSLTLPAGGTGCSGRGDDGHTHNGCHQRRLAAGAEHKTVGDGARRGFQRYVASASLTCSESHQCRGGTRTALRSLVQDFPTPVCSWKDLFLMPHLSRLCCK